jgi:hypothetical protein
MISRLQFAVVALAAAAYAGPPLTTIQDVLYKADGTRFNGVLTISWTSFQAVDNSAIVTQSTTVKVLDGNLRVQLVPSTTATPAGSYSVVYNSDGRIQFRERWAVPSSARALRVREVRVAESGDATAGGSSGGSDSGPIYESDVVGLVADLGSRPVKAANFAAGRVAMVNSAGLLESVSGPPADCVRVDGTTGACGSAPPAFVDGDAPAGIVDGSNASFALAAAPEPASSLSVYRNGLLQKIGLDYTLSGRTIQFVPEAVPQPGDTLLASYRAGMTESGASLIYPSAQVLCSGTGAATTSTSLAGVGTCSIPAGLLQPGDRVEARFDYEHQGAAAFSFEVRWGATVMVHRDAPASETLATGRAEAGIVATGARLNSQSWGTALAFAASVAGASDSYTSGLTIDFLGKTGNTSDTVVLKNFSVVRLP